MALFSSRKTREDADHAPAHGPVHDPAREPVSDEHHTDHHLKEARAEREEARTRRLERVEPETRTIAAPGAYEIRPAMGSLAGRMVLTMIGGGLMILSAFLAWFSAEFFVNGTQVSFRVFDPLSDSSQLASGFIGSAGLVVIGFGLLALLGMGFAGGWLTRIAGALGVLAFVLYAIRVYRASGTAFWQDLGLGVWLLLAGSVVAIVGGFMGTARRVVVEEDVRIAGPTHRGGSWAEAS